jgi:hypothetical protein
MMCESLVNRDWKNLVDRLGGAASLEPLVDVFEDSPHWQLAA